MQWIQTRKRMLKQLKAQVRAWEGADSESLEPYRLNYEKDLNRRWVVSDSSDLKGAIEKAQVVFGADFHAYSQSQRAHLRLLRQLSSDRPIVLALEVFHSTHQQWIDRFLQDQLSEKEFLDLVQWDELWGFPWEFYRPLVILAKSRGWKILGLNREYKCDGLEELQRRDRHAAQVISRARKKDPRALFYVVFGEWHVAHNHLPGELLKIDPNIKYHLVFQDSEKAYFELADKGDELHVDVIRLGRRAHCLMSSPPWVRWQTYLMLLERTFDESLDEDDEDFDTTDQVARLIRLVRHELRIRLNLDSLAVYSPKDESLWESIELDRPSTQAVQFLVESDFSFYLSSQEVGYLSRLTLNHAATLAGFYIHSQLSENTSDGLKMPDEFLQRIWLECVAFFISKMINHKRKAETVQGLTTRLKSSNLRDQGREVLKLALDQKWRETLFLNTGEWTESQIKPGRKSSFLEAAHILGPMLGELFYLQFRKNSLSRNYVIACLKQSGNERGFTKFYQRFLKKINQI